MMIDDAHILDMWQAGESTHGWDTIMGVCWGMIC